jgi:Beta-lactamase enzyme family/ORF 12 gene product N-terminal
VRRSPLVALALLAASCSSATSHTAPKTAATTTVHATSKPASTSPAFVARRAPDTQVGAQLTWLFAAVRSAPLTRQTVDAHFDSSFLKQVDADKINSVLAQLQSPAKASLVGLLSQSPTSLKALATFGGTQLVVSIAVDRAGLIDTLLLTPYLPPSPTSWSQLDRQLAALAPHTGFLAARVSSDGTCAPVHAVASTTPHPLGSMFKLFVLGALTRQIAAGTVKWNRTLTVSDAHRSAGSEAGSLQGAPDGTAVSVQQTATKMISISDNTAADMLIDLVGRSAVESQVRQWTDHAAIDDDPFLTTRELFVLHYVDFPALANHYLGLKPDQRATFLAASVDPVPLDQIRGSTEPRDIDSIEWFATPGDLCRAFAGLQQRSTQPGLAPIGTVLSVNNGGIGLDRAHWPVVWFKGGSEPGVLTLGYLAKNDKDQTYVVVAMAENPTTALPPSATEALLSLVRGAFSLLG